MSTKTEPALQLERMSNLIEAATIDEYETILREKKNSGKGAGGIDCQYDAA